MGKYRVKVKEITTYYNNIVVDAENENDAKEEAERTIRTSQLFPRECRAVKVAAIPEENRRIKYKIEINMKPQNNETDEELYNRLCKELSNICESYKVDKREEYYL